MTKNANDAEEYADAAEDLKSNCDDLGLLLNSIENTVGLSSSRTEMSKATVPTEKPSRRCRIVVTRISNIKSAEKLINTDINNYLSRVQKFLGRDEARERQFQRYKSMFEDLSRKWDKNKTEYKGNAKMSNAVIVANSLG